MSAIVDIVGREVLDSEYSGLIRSYRRNLARSRNAAPERTPGQL